MDLTAIRASVDALTEKMTSRLSTIEASNRVLNEEIEQLQAANKRIGGGHGVPANDNDGHAADLRNENKALNAFIRTGDDGALREIHAANSAGSDPDGGYLIQPVRSDTMTRRLYSSVAMRRLARVITMEHGSKFEEPIDKDEVGALWVGEQTSRSETDSPDLGMLTIPLDEIYALTKVTQRLLDDAEFDVAGWLLDKQSNKFARSENAAFLTGDGINKPRGLLTYATSTADDFSRPWGTLQTVDSGGATSVHPDALYNLLFAVREPYRAGASWLMNDTTLRDVMKLKDGQGNYLWTQGDIKGGQPFTLLGHPVETDPTMPAIAAGSLSIAFGNFNDAYTIVDRPGIRNLRDPFTVKPHVLLYGYRRVGGGLANSEAVKLLKTGTGA